jgi:hypothetical protein
VPGDNRGVTVIKEKKRDKDKKESVFGELSTLFLFRSYPSLSL